MASLQIDDTLFWNLVAYLDKMTHKISLEGISEELGLSPKKILQGIYYLQQVGHPINVDYQSKSGPFIIPPEEKPQIKFQLDLTEWIAFQALFPLIERESKRPYLETLLKKLAEIEEKYPDYQLLNGEMPWPSVSQDKVKVLEKIVSLEEKIKSAINKKLVLEITLNEGRESLKIIPYEIEVLLSGPILIGENLDGHLQELGILNIKKVKIVNDLIKSKFDHKAVEKRIQNIRKKNEKSIRAILKIFSMNKFNLYHGPKKVKNPYVTLNGEGEIIWSATTDIDIHFLEWIDNLSPEVEILSPETLNEAYKKYQEERQKQK